MNPKKKDQKSLYSFSLQTNQEEKVKFNLQLLLRLYDSVAPLVLILHTSVKKSKFIRLHITDSKHSKHSTQHNTCCNYCITYKFIHILCFSLAIFKKIVFTWMGHFKNIIIEGLWFWGWLELENEEKVARTRNGLVACLPPLVWVGLVSELRWGFLYVCFRVE